MSQRAVRQLQSVAACGGQRGRVAYGVRRVACGRRHAAGGSGSGNDKRWQCAGGSGM
jgi:hypothetical protein